MRPADRTILAGLVSALALTGVGVVAGVGQEKKPAAADPFATAFPDIPPKDPNAYPCPRFMGDRSLPADRHDLEKRLAKAELDELVRIARLFEDERLRSENLIKILHVYRRIARVAAEAVGETDALVPWYEEWVSVTKLLEDRVRNNLSLKLTGRDAVQARAERLHAERELLKLKTKLGKR
jgi:hypothetical protein